MLLLRHIRHAAVLNAAALIFCAANLHAAWNLKFPFYHEDQPAVPPATDAPLPKPPTPDVTQPPNPEVSKDTAAAPQSLLQAVIEPVDSTSQPASAIFPTLPVAMENTRLNGRLAPFDNAIRIPATTYTEDTVWQGKVQLDGWITIAPQATLMIAPGTIIRVGAGEGINVLGRIVVKGLAETPVLFASLMNDPLPGEWQGVILTGSEKNNILEHLRIEGSKTGLLARYSSFTARGITIGHAVTGLHLQECVTTMTDTRISDSITGIIAENSELTLDSANIEKNGTGITITASALVASDTSLAGNGNTGLSAENSRLNLDRFLVNGSETGARIFTSQGVVSNSVFRDNTAAGAVLSGSRLKLNGNLFTGNTIGLQIDDHLPVLWNNALANNRSYNLLYMGEKSFFVGGNWFGSVDRGSVDRTLFSKSNGAVQAEPYLGKNPVDKD